jgi:hypothetical protein
LARPQRTSGETRNGYETVWAKDVDEAIKLVESGKPYIDEYGQFF